jgi:hypothetical protein
MMLVGNQELRPPELFEGQLVWMPKEMADTLSIWFDDRLAEMFGEDSERTLAGGRYIVSAINQIEPMFGGTEWIYVHIIEEDWVDEEGIALVYNPDYNYRVTLADQVILDDVLFPCFNTRQELIKANENRFTCSACGKKLNIFGVTLRICKGCEESFT